MAAIGIAFFAIYFGALILMLGFNIKYLYQSDYYSAGFKSLMITLLVCTLASTVVCGGVVMIMAL